MAEAVYMQHLMGIEGVIVDLVQEMTESLADLITHPPTKAIGTGEEGKEEGSERNEGKVKVEGDIKPQFSERELSFLLKLIPELIEL